MHGSTNNGLGYKGIVHLSLYSRATDKTTPIATIQNHGTAKLFEFLSDCLVGNFREAAEKCPTKIMLLNETTDDSDNKIYQAMSDFIVKLTNPVKIDNLTDGITVRFSFAIPEAFNITFSHIGLYLNNTDIYEVSDFAAICSYNSKDSGFSSNDAVLIIDWDLTLSNQKGTANV